MIKRVPKKQSKKSGKSLKLTLLAALLLAIALPVIVGVSQQKQEKTSFAAAPGVVYREGKNLMLNGSPYKFVGFNAYGMTGCWPREWTQQEIDAYFQSLPPASMTRIWAFKDYEDNIPLVIERAEANNQKIVMTLGNGLKNCERGYDGVDNGSSKGSAWFQSGYQTSGWLDYVKSTVTKFKDSPAVGMWEVSNEGGHLSNTDAGIMKAYYDKVAEEIKAIDPNHLVSTGTLAEYTYGGAANYQSMHSSPNIDVVSFHEYDGTGVSSHFEPVMSAANALDKPLIVGETGVDSCDPTRATQLKGKMDSYLAGGAAGVLIWNRMVTGGCGYDVGPNDATSTMVKNYVIPGIALTPQQGVPTSIPQARATTAPTVPTATSVPQSTSTPTPIDSPVGVNLLKNPSFESGLSSWTFISNNSRSNKAAVTSRTKADGRQSAVITIGATSPTIWAIQLEQGNIPLIAGKTYTISFWAKASKTRTIDIVTQQQGGNWTEYHQVTPDLTTAWKKYTYSFNAPVTNISSFAFNLAKTKGTVWIDGVSLTSN